MYLLILFVLLALGASVAWGGIARHSRPRIAAGPGLVAATALFFATLGLWGEVLWFAALGQAGRFWTFFTA